MALIRNYLFRSERLGFRNWVDSDIPLLAEINADPLVMEFFPDTYSNEHTIAFIARMKQQFNVKGFCYFAVDKIEDGEFIGFIGLSEPTFVSDFTPCIDIGWRLSSKHWNKGYATEGAKRCLEFGFKQLSLSKIFAIVPEISKKSEHIMLKIGMKKARTFIHPKLLEIERLRTCLLYEITLTNL